MTWVQILGLLPLGPCAREGAVKVGEIFHIPRKLVGPFSSPSPLAVQVGGSGQEANPRSLQHPGNLTYTSVDPLEPGRKVRGL